MGTLESSHTSINTSKPVAPKRKGSKKKKSNVRKRKKKREWRGRKTKRKEKKRKVETQETYSKPREPKGIKDRLKRKWGK
jgi:hypothetical protein